MKPFKSSKMIRNEKYINKFLLNVAAVLLSIMCIFPVADTHLPNTVARDL